MDSFNNQFLFSILIIALGYFLKQTNLLKEKDGESLARVVFNITLPALIIVTFNDIQFESSLFLLIVIAIIYGLFTGFLGIYLFRKESKDVKGMLAMMVPGFNIGLFAYPLVEVIWGIEGLRYFGMFDVGNAFIVFGLAYLIASYYSGGEVKLDVKTIVWKMSKSVPLMTYIVVCTVNIIGLRFPSVVTEVASTISLANMPLSLLLLGIYFRFTFDKSYVRYFVKYIVLKYVVGLVLGISLFYILPFDDMFKYTLMIGFILPTPTSVLPFAVEFGYDKRFVGTLANLTIVISFILIWLMVNIVT
ncbi:AEC family transporter [Aquibacillus halophilus]|uniref:AEC family transporter n=1 Tax=Aquibacillus halophilus TaxID=930132 RepID=A0A6A8DH95_9BACI|nr:AEC family transporter [Aquibacillus halophilus]MRH43866.1 AEC family transporter [Aquibacillus halophilus]